MQNIEKNTSLIISTMLTFSSLNGLKMHIHMQLHSWVIVNSSTFAGIGNLCSNITIVQSVALFPIIKWWANADFSNKFIKF